MNSNPRIPCDPVAPPAPEPTKEALRKVLLARRRELDGALRARWDGAIRDRILEWCDTAGIRELGVYWPLSGEPDLHEAYAALAARGVQLALPVVVEQHAPLVFAGWIPGEAMRKDAAGVAVPAELRLRPGLGACPPAILVPCVGFNPARLRLGYGGGYYDRTLAAPPRPMTLGVAYTCQAAQFGGDAHDVALTLILTEAGVL